MTREEWRAVGGALLGWWREYLQRSEDQGESKLPTWSVQRNRALSARLRRASTVETLCERAVQDLAERLIEAGIHPLRARDPDRLVSLARTLAEVRTHDEATLARRLGGKEPAMSELRFRRLLRAEGEDLTNALRRAVDMADRRCDVAALGRDILFWGDPVKIAWTFQYHGAEAPARVTEASQ